MNQETASKMLKVTGILCIIGGGIEIIAYFAALIGSIGLTALAGATVGSVGAAAGGLLIIASLIGLIASAAQLIAGILGMVNCNKPEKANICFIFGIIITVIGLISIILGISSSGFNLLSIVMTLALPILYTIGAYFFKNSTNNGGQY